jgi:hypothetical protein
VIAVSPVTSATLGDVFDEVASREPDAVSSTEGNVRIPYADWVTAAEALAESGVRAGDVAALVLPWSVDDRSTPDPQQPVKGSGVKSFGAHLLVAACT